MFHVLAPSIFICNLLFFLFSFSLPEKLQGPSQTEVWLKTGSYILSVGMYWDKGKLRWLPPSVFLPIKSPCVACPLFHNSISRDDTAKTVENPLHHVSSSAMSSLWPPLLFQWLTWTWKMNMGQCLRLCQIQQETGLSTMKSSSQSDYGQIWIGESHFHPWEISWPLFYVLGHKDQVKC